MNKIKIWKVAGAVALAAVAIGSSTALGYFLGRESCKPREVARRTEGETAGKPREVARRTEGETVGKPREVARRTEGETNTVAVVGNTVETVTEPPKPKVKKVLPIRPDVSFAHSGRYLPSVGNRALMLESVNVTNIDCAVRYVLPENIVQLLAREERQYTKSISYWWNSVGGDSEATKELSTAPFEWTEHPGHEFNKTTKHAVILKDDRGVVSNGVYLLTVAIGNEGVEKWGWWARPRYRLVCVTDIGMSVRQDSDGLRLWTTSLASGRPLAGHEVKLYASNRLPLAEGRTDAKGEVTLFGWDPRYKPFALIVSAPDGSDYSFMAIKNSMEVGEPLSCGVRPKYLDARSATAYVWTDRGIYRHGEKILAHALLRNGEGNAPKPFPVTLRLLDNYGREVKCVNKMTDDCGAVWTDEFTAPENLPSGKWKIRVELPGQKDIFFGEREIKIEEFVPPQVRTTLKSLPEGKIETSNLVFKIAAEHLFGGAAKALVAEAMVAFADADFAPEGWKGFRFGDAGRALRPNYTRLQGALTDDKGEAEFSISMDPEWGKPKAAVKMITQGSVLEPGGRASVTRETRLLHVYPYYLGSDIPRYFKRSSDKATFTIAQVCPDGQACKTPRTLKAKLRKLEYAYNLVKNERGEYRWDSQETRLPVEMEGTVKVGEDGRGEVTLPLDGGGDYELLVEDGKCGISHSVAFWVSDCGDDEGRASMKNPGEVVIAADKPVYREGDRPRLTLKCPFRGHAWLTLMREKTLYTRVLEITNLTSVVELDPLEGAWAPNVDVAVSLVQSVKAGADHLACRAHGILPLRVRTRDSEFAIALEASVACAAEGGSDLSVKIAAKSEVSAAERAVITVVDEGINLLTSEPVPDPIGFLQRMRCGVHPLFDMYDRVLPLVDDKLFAGGIKTGGGDLAGMMKRVSPVPTRRFEPLSLWQVEIPLTNGLAETVFHLPEFVGEVRVTAVAYDRRGTGAKAVTRKVCPKLVTQPDAPRFAAPDDRFELTLTLNNRSGAAGEVNFEVSAEGPVTLLAGTAGKVKLKKDDSMTLRFSAAAKKGIGEGVITYRARGFGETHVQKIRLPVRPAVAWEDRSEVKVLHPGEEFVFANPAAEAMRDCTRRYAAVSAAPIAELKAAYDYLAEYPHGCLEQTTSRIFPLLYGIGEKEETKDVIRAGVTRVVSMVRESDFTMWPDCDSAPWDREVSLYAAHFLVEAARTDGVKVNESALWRVRRFLRKWAYDANTNIAAYACHTLALVGEPQKDRMLTLYDMRDKLPLLSRARLARGFVRVGDRKRAQALVADAAIDPKDVREAAFALLTLLELDREDPRIGRLVLYLQRHRDRQRFHWGTTEGNAHALLALGAYYSHRTPSESRGNHCTPSDPARLQVDCDIDFHCKPISGGGDIRFVNRGKSDAFLSLRTLTLPTAAEATNRHHVVRISRRYKTLDGRNADLAKLKRGDILIGQLTLNSDCDYDFSDLVITELLPACFEPERKEVADQYRLVHGNGETAWVLRSDARDDRILVYSKPVKVFKDQTYRRNVFYYAVRVVSSGVYVLPGTQIEAMYAPEIYAANAAEKIVISD